MSTKKSIKKFDTDGLMIKLYLSLVGDFRTVMGDDYREESVRHLLNGDMTAFRSMISPDRLQSPPKRKGGPPSVFKMEAQIESLFKRYRFATDMYTDSEVSNLTFAKFSALQLHLARQDWKPLPQRAFTVVQRARHIVKEILDAVDPSDFHLYGRYSTRATVGNSASDAYLDHKLADPITGSPEHIKWFKSHLRTHGYLRDVIAQCSPSGEPCFEVCESLPLVGVPKSYKSLRLISPNTLIGSYRTYGIGSLLVRALKAEGLDIAKLQFRHRRLARKNSKTRKLVTADMSAASESFLWSLICRLLPRKWLRVVNEGRLKYYNHNGERYHYCSFMAMGIGFTFPLQTLLFYALLKAVQSLTGIAGKISVYGDDLIYPHGMHRFVSTIFTDLGMKINEDKTFVNSHFRESCGGDYYHGEDVRPFNPEGQHQALTRRKYEAWLYKICNGLFERWSEDFLPKTVRLLRHEILQVTPTIKQVPPSFPVSSGWRKKVPVVSASCFFGGYSPVLVRFRHGSREFVFSHLIEVPRKRYVSFEIPYLYDWLRSKDVGELSNDYAEPLINDIISWMRLENWKEMRRLKWDADGRPSISLSPYPKQPRNYRGQDGKRLRRSHATTPCTYTDSKIQTNVTDSISDWT